MEKINSPNDLKDVFPKFSILAAISAIVLDQMTTFIALRFFNCVEANPIASTLINLGLQYWLVVDYAICGLVLLLIILFGEYVLKSTLPYLATFPLTLGRFYAGIHNLTIMAMILQG